MPLNIVIPMAGRGSRFADAGYAIPKPLIPLHGVPMIQAVVHNLTPTNIDCRHTFIVLQEHIDAYAVDDQLRKLVPECTVVVVDQVTQGAACTVLLARDMIDSEDPLMLANSDQFVDVDITAYLSAIEQQELDGLIMTFWADHPKWSYCRMGQAGLVTEVIEKQVVSNEATVGIYNFCRGSDFVKAADRMIALDKRVNGEFYVAPVYNELIATGGRIGVYNIGEQGKQMHGLGTPEDLEQFLAQPKYKSVLQAWHQASRDQ